MQDLGDIQGILFAFLLNSIGCSAYPLAVILVSRTDHFITDLEWTCKTEVCVFLECWGKSLSPEALRCSERCQRLPKGHRYKQLFTMLFSFNILNTYIKGEGENIGKQLRKINSFLFKEAVQKSLFFHFCLLNSAL